MGCHAPLELTPPSASMAAAKRAAQRVHWQCFAQFWAEKAPRTLKGPWRSHREMATRETTTRAPPFPSSSRSPPSQERRP